MIEHSAKWTGASMTGNNEAVLAKKTFPARLLDGLGGTETKARLFRYR